MFGSMYDGPVVTWLGLPAWAPAALIGGALGLTGPLWLRRNLVGAPELESYRATARPRRNWALIARVALARLAIALPLVALRP